MNNKFITITMHNLSGLSLRLHLGLEVQKELLLLLHSLLALLVCDLLGGPSLLLDLLFSGLGVSRIGTDGVVRLLVHLKEN